MSEASLTRPWMFVLDCRSIRNASGGSHAPAVSRLGTRFVLVPRSVFLGGDLLVRKHVKTVLQTVRCSQRNESSTGANSVSKESNQPQREMRMYQTWRNPSWLHHYQVHNVSRVATRRAVNYQPFKGMRDAMFRFACAGLLFAGLGALHYLFHRADRFVRRQVQVASAKIDSDIAIGRVVRCNPLTGIRVKNVSVARASPHSFAPFGTASYLDASVSGVYGLLLRRRALRLNVSVEGAHVTVPHIVTKEYAKTKMKAPQLEDSIRMLAGEWRDSATWRSLSFPSLLEPSTVTFHRSKLRLEGTQHTLVSKSNHVVEVVNMSGRLDLSTSAHSTAAHRQRRENGMDMIFVKGNFRGGGSARIGVNTSWSHDTPAKAPVPSVAATLTCSKFNIGSIASFVSLPFKLIDGYCTGSVELELSPVLNAIPIMNGQAEVKSLGIRFDPNPENPELRNLTGRVRFKEKSLLLGQVEGHLGSIPLEAEGRVDFVEGFNVVSHARPFDVNKIIDTFALDRFIPVGGSVIGKAVVRGALDEPFVSGWIKAVGNRARADRVLLKSAVMMYDWDAAAGNLLFPSLKAEVVGGGEVTGSGGIYFDMTQETPYRCSNEKHHSRNPKAQYWNPGVRVDKVIPSHSTDDFEVDKWAPFRPYDSMEFKIKGSGVAGQNLLRWYGKKYGEMATEAIGLMNGFCHMSGHVDDANSRLVWRSARDSRVNESHEKSSAAVPSNGAMNEPKFVNGRKATQLSSKQKAAKSNTQGDEALPDATNGFVPSQHAQYREHENTEYLGGVVHMKLGDLPEARRVKVRTILKDFNVKRLFAGEPAFRDVLLRAPNAVSNMDTFFKGTVCMRPSWEEAQARKAGRKTPLDLVSIDGALAVRKLTINGVIFRNVISGSLSLSATDISVSLTERNSQDTNATNADRPLVSDGREDMFAESQSSLDKLEVSMNARGIVNIFVKQGKSEMSASISLDDRMHRVAQLHAKNLNLQEVSGEYNPMYEDEALQGILNTSIQLDLTGQTGLINFNVTDLALGPLHFVMAEAQFQLGKGEVSLLEATVQQRLSKYKFNGKFVSRGYFSDSEWFVNVNVDRAHIRDLARLIEGGKAIMDSVPPRHETADHVIQRSYQATPWRLQMRDQLARQDSSVTYWEVPIDLPFSEQMKWYSESVQKDSDADLSRALDAKNNRINTPFSLYHTGNHLSGRISIHYAPRQNRGKRKKSALGATDRGLLQVFDNTSLSFNLAGRNWILGENKIELMTVSGFLEDGSLSVGPAQVRGSTGFLADAECRVTNAGSLNGSVNLRNAPVSNIEVFQKAGFEARGDISGKFGMQGTISNPSVYGQMLWQDATVNGRKVHQPHADLACSNGRCVINVDAEVGGKGRQRNVNHAGADDLAVSEPVDEPLLGDATMTGFTQMKSISKRTKDVDSVRARISIPVKLFVHQYVLPRVPRRVLPDHLGALENQVPFDDDWIYASVDIKRYGMVLLNAAMPKLGWIAGESDILIRVSGTLENPEVEGTVKFRDGSMRPVWMVHPLHSLKGEVELRELGVISCKSLSGRCNGRGFSLRGGMFLTRNFEDRLQNKVQEMQQVMSVSDSGKKRRSRILRASLDEAVSKLRQGRGGIRIEAGGIPIHIDDVCSGTVSGKFSVRGTAMNPEIDGSLLFSEGVVSANSALSEAGKAMRERSSSPMVGKNLNAAEKTMSAFQERTTKFDRIVDNGKIVEEDRNDQQTGVQLKQLKVSLGRNVRVTHSFLFNVLVAGNTSLSGDPTNPTMTGKINILSGSVSALPARWAIRKSENSYINFAHNPEDTEEKEELMIKLVLESDTMILRVSECEASTWMEHLSLSDKSGNRVPEGWSDAIHESDDDKRGNRRRIVNMLTGLMINTLVVGGEIGKYDWRVFPTYFGDVLPKLSKRTFDKYGAGFQLDQGNICFESNMFLDKFKGGQVMVKLAKALSVHFFGDQNRRFANFELRLPGKR